jgi:hypothetical protein
MIESDWRYCRRSVTGYGASRPIGVPVDVRLRAPGCARADGAARRGFATALPGATRDRTGRPGSPVPAPPYPFARAQPGPPVPARSGAPRPACPYPTRPACPYPTRPACPYPTRPACPYPTRPVCPYQPGPPVPARFRRGAAAHRGRPGARPSGPARESWSKPACCRWDRCDSPWVIGVTRTGRVNRLRGSLNLPVTTWACSFTAAQHGAPFGETSPTDPSRQPG